MRRGPKVQAASYLAAELAGRTELGLAATITFGTDTPTLHGRFASSCWEVPCKGQKRAVTRIGCALVTPSRRKQT
jgi:hypothetical protein